MASDYDSFPASIYAQSVLAPDLDIYRQHFSAPLHALNLSHGVMLAERGLLQSADAGADRCGNDGSSDADAVWF